MTTHIMTYDTTLRDGEQGGGISFSLKDKLRIVTRLDELGVDYIEGGYPASNPKDLEFFEQALQLPLKHARIVAFGSTCHKGTPAEADLGLEDLIASKAPVVTIVGKCDEEQVLKALRTSLSENLRMIRDSVEYLRAAGVEVIFDAEHFFDGYRANPEYALSCVRAASEAGALSIDLCDTKGGTLPSQIGEIVQDVAMALPGQRIGIHCHNDAGCAIANTLSGIAAGATQFQGTVNGIGERTGNADLLVCIANLQLKMGYECVEDLTQLTSVANYVAETANVTLPANTPYTGSSAFAHKGGLHASAIARMPTAYSHEDPASVGNKQHVLVSELSGRASIAAKAKALGLDLDDKPELVAEILDEVKEREAAGYSYEVADGSLALLMMRHMGIMKQHFTLESFRVIVDDREDTGASAKDAESEATIKIHVGEDRYVAVGEGVGPVGALDTALRQAIITYYPGISDIELIDFKVRILDGEQGTDSITRVTITTADANGSWGTVGVSENVIEASWNALVDSIEYGLARMEK